MSAEVNFKGEIKTWEFLDKALKTVKNVGDSLVESATNVSSSAGTSVQDNAELNSLKNAN
ncbi:MAG: hypothetical protein ACLUUG_06860 [Lachnospiraceae bacterium]